MCRKNALLVETLAELEYQNVYVPFYRMALFALSSNYRPIHETFAG